MDDSQDFSTRTFQSAESRVFEISRIPWATIHNFQQHERHTLEAGGVLLGRHLLDKSAIIVDQVTTPLPGDRRTRTSFYRSQKRHQKIIDQVWQASNGTCTYLGEWHTHPEPVPMPSMVDWRGWLKRLATDQFTEPLFFVIVGTQHTCVWEGTRNGVITPLQSSAKNRCYDQTTTNT